MSKRVLIIEDDKDIAKILTVRFRAAGFEIRHAEDGLYGVQQAREFNPDVIVLDMMLPAGGGLGVLKNLQMSVYSNAVPVIVYSGMQDETRKKEVEELGVAAYFQKPYDPQKIVEKAKEIIG